MNFDYTFVKNNKTLLFQVILGISAVICASLIFFQFRSYFKLSKEILNKRTILADINMGIKNFNAYENELDLLITANKNLKGRLNQQKEFPDFLNLVSKMAKENNVKIIAIEPQKPIEDPKFFYIQTSVYVDAYCGYHELGKFINNLEYSTKFIKIKNIKMENDDTNPHKLHVFLVISTFSLKEEEDENIFR